MITSTATVTPTRSKAEPCALRDHDAGRRQQRQAEGREDEGRQQRPGSERLRGAEAAELAKPEGARDQGPAGSELAMAPAANEIAVKRLVLA